MQYQQTPQGLETLYNNLPVSATPQAMSLLGQQQDADQLTAQDNQRQFKYDTANDPLKLRGNSLDNDIKAAQLPGHVAMSNMHVRTDANQALTNDAAIKDMMGKYSSAELGRHATDAETLGQRLSQMGEEAFSNPLGASARVKAELEKLGHGDMWNPDWETSHPGLLARQLGDYGNDIMNSSAKLRNALEVGRLKNEGLQGVATTRAQAQEEVARINSQQRASTAQALFAMKGHLAKIPKGLEDYAAKMRELARQAQADGNDAESKKYLAEAVSAEKAKENINNGPARVNVAPKPNLNALGLETVGPNAQPNRTPGMAGAQGQVPGWPEGAVANPDGSVTYNGQTYKKKGQ